MRTIDVIRISGGHLRQTRTRSSLTILGVIIGIGAIVLLVSLGVGLQKITTEQLSTFEALTVISVNAREGSANKLDDQAVSKLQLIPGVQKVSPIVELPAEITYQGVTTSTLIQGLNSDSAALEGLDIKTGKIFSDNLKEAVPSKAILKTLGKDNENDALGREIKVKVVSQKDNAELEAKRLDLKITGVDNNEKVGYLYLPLDQAIEAKGEKIYDKVDLKATNRKTVEQVKTKVEEQGFTASTLKDLIDQVDKIFLILEIVLAMIGGIGLFVASLGIINTMTISLLERTHEIGIMKALGASSGDVKKIFVCEATLIGLLGGTIGVAGGFLIGEFFNLIINAISRANGGSTNITPFITSPLFAVGILLFSIFIGLLTGFWPARRAAKLSPMEALRTE